jgi:hypothetical protein
MNNIPTGKPSFFACFQRSFLIPTDSCNKKSISLNFFYVHTRLLLKYMSGVHTFRNSLEHQI